MSLDNDAHQLLNNPAFQSALDDIEAGIVDRWKSASVTDKEAQTYLKLLLKIHGDYAATLRRYITDGKIEGIKIERENKIANLFKRKFQM